MKLEFAILPHGPHATPKAKPGYLKHPEKSSVEYQKRKAEEEESEAKRRKKAEDEMEV